MEQITYPAFKIFRSGLCILDMGVLSLFERGWRPFNLPSKLVFPLSIKPTKPLAFQRQDSGEEEAGESSQVI